MQDAPLEGKVVLVRVDHNCVKGGKMTDAFRVDATIATLYNIVERGGRPILMSHVGRGLRPFIRFIKKIFHSSTLHSSRACVQAYAPSMQARHWW